MGYKIAATTGIGHGQPSLPTVIQKLGYAITRGVNMIEIASDVPHEINYTEGKEIRYICKKQGIDVLLHGSLTVPICIPERLEWRDADNHLKKSITSAVYGGAKYVLFHACLNMWLEMMSYAGKKLYMTFCDHDGHFISKLLSENERLRKWYIEKSKANSEYRSILTGEDYEEMGKRINKKLSEWEKDELKKGASGIGISGEKLEKILSGNIPEGITQQQLGALESIRNQMQRKVENKKEQFEKEVLDDILEEHLAQNKEWRSEEAGGMTGPIEAYNIMAHYLFYTKDPIWCAMADMYKDVLSDYNLSYSNDTWPDEAWKKAENTNDRKFKEFYYAVCGAKFVEGHLKAIFRWMDEELIPNLPEEELKEIARELKITLEIPDARDPSSGGLFILCHPKQIYAAVKTIRKTLNTDRLFMTIDFEHNATQGWDPQETFEELPRIAPDVGKYVISCHVTTPAPLHQHKPVEIGDDNIYRLLYNMRQAGMGKETDTILVFERGGGDDPFKKSITALRLMADQLEKNTHPDELPLEFYGISPVTETSEQRQRLMIGEHMGDPLKGMLMIPEEDYTFLSSVAMQKPGGAEKWKKAENR